MDGSGQHLNAVFRFQLGFQISAGLGFLLARVLLKKTNEQLE